MDQATIDRIVATLRLQDANKVESSMGKIVFRDGTEAEVFRFDVSYTYDGLIGGLHCAASATYLREDKEKGEVLESETVRDLVAECKLGDHRMVEHYNYGRSLRECRFQMQARWEDPAGEGQRRKDVIWYMGTAALQRPVMELIQEAASKVDAMPGSVLWTWIDLS